ncbi:hypothetical protein Peur_005535 [Populus x canadensis]
MSRIRENRMRKELSDIASDNSSEYFSAGIATGNTYDWEATVHGPPLTPYAGGVFRLGVSFPQEYPFKPPKLTFLTKIYHPNINDKGSICVDILKNNWTAANTMTAVFNSILLLLASPNPDDPLVPGIGKQYINDRLEFEQVASMWTVKYAA